MPAKNEKVKKEAGKVTRAFVSSSLDMIENEYIFSGEVFLSVLKIQL